MTRPRTTPDEAQEFNALKRRTRALEQQIRYSVTNETIPNIRSPEYGGLGNGVDDDTDAIIRFVDDMAARRCTGLMIGKYPTTEPVQLQSHMGLQGDYKQGDEADPTAGTTIAYSGTGQAVIFPNSGAGGYTQIAAIELLGLRILSPNGDGIYVPNGGAGGARIDTVFVACTGKHMHLRGFRQDWRVNSLRLDNGGNGDWGWFDDGQAGVGGDESREDDCRIEYLYVGGMLNHGILRRPLYAASNVWVLPRVVTCAGHGIVWAGGIAGDTVISANFEANGYGGPSSYLPPTTGSITTGTNQLTVVSTTGLAGAIVTVEGAGASGYDLTATVISIAGSVLTLSVNAGRTVTAAEVTSALYDDFYLGPDLGPQDTGGHATHGGAPFGNTIITANAGLGGIRTDHNLRYAINLSGVYGNTVISGQGQPRPIYDPAFLNEHPGASDQAAFAVVKYRPSRGRITPVMATGWTGNLKLRRIGKKIEASGKATAGPTAGPDVFTVPPWMIPPGVMEGTRGALNPGGIVTAYVAMDAGGVVSSNQYADTTILFFEGFSYSMEA